MFILLLYFYILSDAIDPTLNLFLNIRMEKTDINEISAYELTKRIFHCKCIDNFLLTMKQTLAIFVLLFATIQAIDVGKWNSLRSV